MEYKKLSSVEEVVDKANEKPLFIFKHSITCPISAAAKREMDIFIKENNDYDVYLVIVQDERDLSNEIAKKLNIEHESPQLLFMKKGSVDVLNHHSINNENIKKIISKNE